MKNFNRILVGSQAFFNGFYTDFEPKDIDEVEFVDTDEFKEVRQITGKNRCLFQMKRHKTTQEYIDWALKNKAGMVIGKFLVPDFCKAINFTIKDLKLLQPLLERLDERHAYEKIIYDAYIKNGEFTLTQEQRDLAYKKYKEAR